MDKHIGARKCFFCSASVVPTPRRNGKRIRSYLFTEEYVSKHPHLIDYAHHLFDGNRQITQTDRICHACLARANRVNAAKNTILEPIASVHINVLETEVRPTLEQVLEDPIESTASSSSPAPQDVSVDDYYEYLGDKDSEQIRDKSLPLHPSPRKAKRYSYRRPIPVKKESPKFYEPLALEPPELEPLEFNKPLNSNKDDKTLPTVKAEPLKCSYNNMCRVCLLQKDENFWIFDENSNIFEKIEFCTGLKITKNDNKPSKICITCNNDLNSAYEFKTTYIKSDTKLSKFLNTKPNKRKFTVPKSTEESQTKKIKKELENCNEEGFTSTVENVEGLTSSIEIVEKTTASIDNVEETTASIENVEGFTSSIDKVDEGVKEERVFNDDVTSDCDNDFDANFNDDDDISSFCPNENQTKERLTGHVEVTNHRRSKPRDTKCAVCKAMFPTKQLRNEHFDDVHLYTRWYCNVCKKFVYEAEEKHKLLHSAPQLEYCQGHQDITPPKKKHECDICGSKFDKWNQLLSHSKVHKSEYWICPICGIQGTGSITGHLSTHSSAKKFECHDCGHISKTKKSIYNHVKKYHLKLTQKFQCEMCPKILTTIYGLRQHKKRVHLKERHFKCLECGAMQFSRVQHRNHMFKHNGIKDLKCELCDSAFARITYLKNHMLKEHGVNVPNCNKNVTNYDFECSADFIRNYLVSIGRLKC